MDLRGKAVLITGASRGLGAALARTLAGAQGSKVVAVARGARELDAVVREIRERGGEAHSVRADVGDKDAVHAIAGTAAALAGPIDVLIHCASTLGKLPMPILLDTECEDLAQVLEVNLVGPFRLTKAIVGSMALRGEGAVIFVSSDAAVEPYPGWGAYGVSKAALEQLGRIWAKELEGTGVRSIVVDPGEMRTQMHADALPDADPATLADPADVAERIVSMLRDERRAPSGARLAAASWRDDDAAHAAQPASKEIIA